MTTNRPADEHRDPPSGGLDVLGLTGAQERVYRTVVRSPGASVDAVAERAGLPVGQVVAALGRLTAAGLVDNRDRGVVARPPEQALQRLLADEMRHWRERGSRLESVRDAVLPALNADHLSASLPAGEPVGMELVDRADAATLLKSLAVGATGDLLWMQPDQWKEPSGDLDAWVQESVRAGRRSRALYPARVLEDAPHVLWDRAGAGEHVRILAEVPCRLAILGDTLALLSEEYGVPSARRLVVRHPSVVATLRLVFDTLWEKAMAVPGLDGQQRHRDALARGLLLDLLADGAKDEQISRELGVSLRTVRRRVAELLDDLGAESRFQAGVEAVRRGWV